jgi:cellobiose transport system substrate-binding protein
VTSPSRTAFAAQPPSHVISAGAGNQALPGQPPHSLPDEADAAARHLDDLKWDIAAVPGSAGNWGGSFLAIPKRAKNPQAAWKYISEMQSPAGQLEHFLAQGSLPTTPSVYSDPKLIAKTDPFFSNAPIGKIYTDSAKAIKPFYIGLNDATIGSELLNTLTTVEQGKVEPAKAWDTALTNVKNALRADR